MAAVMTWLFRKRVRLLPGVTLNLGKRGVSSVSIGPRSAKVRVDTAGHTTVTASIPGTGLTWREKIATPEPDLAPDKHHWLRVFDLAFGALVLVVLIALVLA